MLETPFLLKTMKTLEFLVKIKISVQVYRSVSTVVIHALFLPGVTVSDALTLA